MYNRCTLTPICMHTLSAHDGRKSFWGSTTYASHENLVTLNIFSWHWRASYNFSWPAVQYSLEVSLTRLYRTKPMWETWTELLPQLILTLSLPVWLEATAKTAYTLVHMKPAILCHPKTIAYLHFFPRKELIVVWIIRSSTVCKIINSPLIAKIMSAVEWEVWILDFISLFAMYKVLCVSWFILDFGNSCAVSIQAQFLQWSLRRSISLSWLGLMKTL